MAAADATLSWHDPSWRISSDNPLQAGLRLQQAWWRQARCRIREAGPLHPPPKPGKPERLHSPLVVSMLPEAHVGFAPNLMWPEAVGAYEAAKRALNAGAGIIYEDRLRRNLLSSQPLCFNLFGYLSEVDTNALLPWVRLYASQATSVSRILLEYSPSVAELGVAPLGGSAFDAFVEYTLPGDSKGFIGVETKYHEDLAKGLRIPREGSAARDKYTQETRRRPWLPDAESKLIAHRKNLQFWYNQLLAQRTFELVTDSSGRRTYAEFTEVVVACRQDQSAKAVVGTVAAQLASGHEGTLRFCALDDVLDTVSGHDDWKRDFRERYTDFTPIQKYVAANSPLSAA
ncbi:MAG: hypothetical protein WAT19_07980 [Ferruginibacter sp.]